MTARRARATAFLAATAAAVGGTTGGCGGGGPGDDSRVLAGDGARDCTVDTEGVILVMPGSPASPQMRPTVAAGTAIPGGWRALFSFDLAPIPMGATVTEAILWLYESDYVPTIFGPQMPTPLMGSILVDHVAFGDPDASDHSGSAIASAFASIPHGSLLVTEQYKIVNVTSRVQNDVAMSRPRSQYRLRFANEAPAVVIGGVEFTDGEHAEGTGGPGPLLFVYYTPP